MKLWFLLIALSLLSHAYAQSYIKSLSDPDRSVRQKIIRFKNGDLLIGDSYFEGAQGATAPFILTRMDHCGLMIWSFAYERQGLQLQFRDFAIDDQEQIFVYGSAFGEIRESIFLMVLNEQGEEIKFRIYNTDTPSSSSFTLAIRNDRVLIMGRLLEIGTSTTGFLASFDRQLNFQWGKKLSPFTPEGAAIIDIDGSLVARTEAFHYKFDPGGKLLWAKRFERSLDPQPIGGPFKVSGGYIYEAYFQEEAFVYKLDPNGQLLWQSTVFPSSKFPVAVQEMSGGILILHYSAPGTDGNVLHQIKLNASGELLDQRVFTSGVSTNIGSVFHSFGSDETINLVGNNDAIISLPADLSEFLIQYKETEDNSSCFEWQNSNTAVANDLDLSFPLIDPTQEDLILEIETSGSINSYELDAPFRERCNVTPEPQIIRADSLLDCNERWEVSLPSEEFEWQDNFQGSPRWLESSGLYRARNNDCDDPIIYEFDLQRAVCDCPIFVPNAFSPNGDGQNDLLQFFTNCQINSVQSTVFDRWGNLIFEGQSAEELWDGTFLQDAAQPGVYVIMIKYQLLSESGGTQEGTLAREVLLLR